jgi:hypothetical protein
LVLQNALRPGRGQPEEILARVIAQGILHRRPRARPASDAGQADDFGRAVFQSEAADRVAEAPLGPLGHLAVDRAGEAARLLLVGGVAAKSVMKFMP